jgi:hypothetical protein
MSLTQLPSGLTLTYPAIQTSVQDQVGMNVLPSGVPIPPGELQPGRSYGLVIVTSSDSYGLLVCAGQETKIPLFQTSDQNGLPIFWSGLINGSAGGWYASLGSYADNLHQLGWYNDPLDALDEHGYSFINKWGSAPFDVGAAAAFHGSPILIKPLQAPTLQTRASASRVFILTPPEQGSYTLSVNGATTAELGAAHKPTDVQDALHALPGCSGITFDESAIAESTWPASITVPAALGEVTTSNASISEAALELGTTYYYVATAVANDKTETVSGPQVSYTPTTDDPSVELAITQNWGMSYAKIYRSTINGGPYSLVGILRPYNPYLYDGVHCGITMVDGGLNPLTNVSLPTAPNPTPTVWQAWSGEDSSNVKLEGQDFSGATQWSITAGGKFRGSNVGSALKTTPLYSKKHSVTPSSSAGVQGKPATFSPNSGFSCIFPFGNTGIIGASSGVNAETLTVELKANYSDSASRTATIDFTSDTVAEMGVVKFAELIKDGVTITSFILSVASSIDDSGASVSFTIVGTNGL